MTQTELVSAILRRTVGIPRVSVLKVVEAVLPSIFCAVLESGESVVFPGFGTFYPVDLKPKKVLGGRMSSPRRKVRFRQSRRAR
jgi:nucleoid DNA-binding protein